MVLWPQRRSVCASVCRSGAEAVGSALACRLLRPPSAPLSVPHASASSLDTRMADGVTGVCCGLRAFHFADRLRAGAGRRSGSGRRPGRVRWGRPLLSRPRGAFGSGAAAEAPAAVDVLSRPRIRSSRGRAGVLVGMDGCEVRLCDPCARARPCVPCVSRLPLQCMCLFKQTS